MKRGLSVVLFVIVAGCGSGEIPVSPESVGTEGVFDAGFSDAGDDSATATYRTLLSATCSKAFECCSVSTARAISGLFEESECQEQSLRGFSSIAVQGLEEALRVGSVSLDSSAAELCRQSVDELSCAEWTSTQATRLSAPGCQEAIEPLLDTNSSCTADFECRSGRCLGLSDGTTVCAEVREDGESCDPAQGQTCRDGSYCDNFDAFRCVAFLNEGSPCVSDFECATSRCEPGPNGANICMSLQGVCAAAPIE